MASYRGRLVRGIVARWQQHIAVPKQRTLELDCPAALLASDLQCKLFLNSKCFCLFENMVVVNCLNSGFSVCVILQIYFELLISQLNISYPLALVHPVQKLELVKTQLLSFQHTIAADFTRFSCIEYALEQVNFLV